MTVIYMYVGVNLVDIKRKDIDHHTTVYCHLIGLMSCHMTVMYPTIILNVIASYMTAHISMSFLFFIRLLLISMQGELSVRIGNP